MVKKVVEQEEDPSRLRVEKVGISGLPKDMTLRLPEVGDGERRWRSGRGGGEGGSQLLLLLSFI